MKVHWTGTAEAHLDAIYTYIAQTSATYALRTVDRITKRSQQIGKKGDWRIMLQTPVWERIPGSSSFQTRAGNAAQPVLKGMKQELLSIGYPNWSLGTSTKLVTTY